jgi:hypothetical protein
MENAANFFKKNKYILMFIIGKCWKKEINKNIFGYVSHRKKKLITFIFSNFMTPDPKFSLQKVNSDKCFTRLLRVSDCYLKLNCVCSLA